EPLTLIRLRDLPCARVVDRDGIQVVAPLGVLDVVAGRRGGEVDRLAVLSPRRVLHLVVEPPQPPPPRDAPAPVPRPAAPPPPRPWWRGSWPGACRPGRRSVRGRRRRAAS